MVIVAANKARLLSPGHRAHCPIGYGVAIGQVAESRQIAGLATIRIVAEDFGHLLSGHRLIGHKAERAVVIVGTVDHLVGNSPVGSTGVPHEGLNIVHTRGVGRVSRLVRCGSFGVGCAPENHGELRTRKGPAHAEQTGIGAFRIAGDKALRGAERHALGIPLGIIDVGELRRNARELRDVRYILGCAHLDIGTAGDRFPLARRALALPPDEHVAFQCACVDCDFASSDHWTAAPNVAFTFRGNGHRRFFQVRARRDGGSLRLVTGRVVHKHAICRGILG